MSASLVLEKFLSGLWLQYKTRVQYAAQYQDMVENMGGRLRNDHIAFRTLNTKTGSQPSGVEALSRIFGALGYERRDQYRFPDKKLTAWHWQHKENLSNPKIFISQLEVEQLTPNSNVAIKQSVKDCVDGLSKEDLLKLNIIDSSKTLDGTEASELAKNLIRFCSRPWQAPLRKVVEALDKESQYAAWTLLHGNSVNHFTAYINEQNVPAWPDLESTVLALRLAGVPMKAELEGEPGSKLRQSSTRASLEECEIIEDNGQNGKIKWSYAYYELAERGTIPGPDGKPTRFQGFLGDQATNLFEMTKRN